MANEYIKDGTSKTNIFDLVNTNLPIPKLNSTMQNINVSTPQSLLSKVGNINGINGIASAVGGLAGNAIAGGLTSGVGNAIGGVGKLMSAIPGPIGMIGSAAAQVVGGVVNRAFGSKLNDENIKKIEGITDNLNSFTSNANSYNSLADQWGNTALGANFSDSYIGKDGWFSDKAKDKAQELRDNLTVANAWVENSLQNNADNLNNNQFNTMETNYAACGGKLNKFEYGGTLSTHGADFPTGLTYLMNGGTHEENPYGGIPMGTDEQGKPNLVEAGETMFDDYVFSNRLTVPKDIKNKYKLKKNMTFSKAAKQLSKEYEETPNDSISKRGLEALMKDLTYSQEKVKENLNNAENQNEMLNSNVFKTGGDTNKPNNETLGTTLDYDNSTKNILFNEDPDYKFYNSDGTINFDLLYAANSPYYNRRQYVIDNWDNPLVQEWRKKYINSVNDYNKNRKDYTPFTYDSLTKDKFTKGSFDKKWGGMHQSIIALNNPKYKQADRYYIRGKDADGKPIVTLMDKSQIPYKGYDDTGRTWEETNKLKFVGKQIRPLDEKTNTIYTDYYYDPTENAVVNTDNAKIDNQNIKKYPEWLRYAPLAGLGLASITDALGWTNKPNYEAAGMLEAAAKKGNYMPVDYSPIGNYLEYNPFDTDYATNKLNAEASATRRAINNQAATKGAAINSILAADNNALNSLGDMYQKAKEYNNKQREQVETFNRSTDQYNSQSALQADSANQQALASLRKYQLQALGSAADARYIAWLQSENNKMLNLSNLFQGLGDIGYENANRNMVNTLYGTGVLGRVGDNEAKGFKLIKD